MNNIEINEVINKLRSSGNKIITNCFINLNSDINTITDIIKTDNSIVIIKNDYRVKRILFYTNDLTDLKNLLGRLCNEHFTIEILSRDKTFLTNELTSSGFSILSSMMRISNRDVTSDILNLPTYKYFDENTGTAALISDTDEIYDLLWNTFDTRISHLPDKNELKKIIRANQITVFKNGSGKITSLLQSISEPKSFYINQVYNSDTPDKIHAILINQLLKYKKSGGKYIYSWVEETNIRSVKFHQKYNMKHDGLWNIVYTNCK